MFCAIFNFQTRSNQRCKFEQKNKRTTISNDTLIIIHLLIKVDIHRYSSISPLIFANILSVSLSIGCCFLETKR